VVYRGNDEGILDLIKKTCDKLKKKNPEMPFQNFTSRAGKKRGRGQGLGKGRKRRGKANREKDRRKKKRRSQ